MITVGVGGSLQLTAAQNGSRYHRRGCMGETRLPLSLRVLCSV